MISRNRSAFPPLLQGCLSAAAKRPVVGRATKPAWANPNPIHGMALSAMVFILCLENSHAASWYVEPSSAGSNNGTSWSNAWSMATLNSNWATVQPGDTVWIAGGKYTTSMQPGTNGTAAAPILVMRPQGTDSVPTSSPGWSSSFNAQVLIEPSGSTNNNSPLMYNSNSGNYMTFNGRVANGIRFYSDSSYNSTNQNGGPSGALDFGYGSGGNNNISFNYCEFSGPGSTGTSGSIYVLNFYTWNGNNYGGVSGLLFSNCYIHGGVAAIASEGLSNSTIENCEFSDIGSDSSSYHSNCFQIENSSGNTFRYNNVHDWQIEGFFWLGVSGTWYIYGNVFHDCSNASARFMELASGSNTSSNGPLYIWNNTFYNIPLTIFSGAGGSTGSYSSSNSCENNIFWACGGVFENFTAAEDYNYFGGGNAVEGTGKHNVSGSGATPFVTASKTPTGGSGSGAGDPAVTAFEIVSTLGSNYPRNLGLALSSDGYINKDLVGDTRGADGSWDIGAFEYSTASTATPTPSPATVQDVRFN